jgi:DNA-binding transcriptional ArsR family regulator
MVLVNQMVNQHAHPMSPDRLNLTFAALADPTRRAMLRQLARGVATVTALAEPHAMSLPAISKHLRVLEHSGLIERGRNAQWRPCRLKAEPLKEAVDWLEQYRRHWEESLDRLDEYLQQLQAKQSQAKGNKHERQR